MSGDQVSGKLEMRTNSAQASGLVPSAAASEGWILLEFGPKTAKDDGVSVRYKGNSSELMARGAVALARLSKTKLP